MAYPPKKITTEQYENFYINKIENIQYGKIYYMPEITDGTVTWRIKFYNSAEPDGSPYLVLNETSIGSGYRVLLTKKLGIGNEQFYVVAASGYDSQNKPWVQANKVINSSDIDFRNLPTGTVVYWVVRTFFPPAITKYTATIDGQYYNKGEYIGTYLDYGIRPVILPSGNLTAEGVYTTVFNVNVCIVDTNGTVIKNQEYKPRDYEILEFLSKNEAIIL